MKFNHILRLVINVTIKEASLMKYLLMITLCAITPSIFAEGLRCGNNIVTTGDSKATVLKKCGQPEYANITSYKTVKKGNERIEAPIEELVYGKNTLTFEAGKLKTVTFQR